MRVLFPASGVVVALAVLFLACGGEDGNATAATAPDASGGDVAADGAATGETGSGNPSDAGAEASAADAEATAKVTITLATDGDGTGTVEVDPPGGVYDVGTKLTLSATATTGTFIGWSGVPCDPPAEGVVHEEVCHVTVASSTTPFAVFGARTLTGSANLAMSRFSETNMLGGTSFTCNYKGSSNTTTVTIDLAVLKSGAVMGKARSASSMVYLEDGSPLVCDSVVTEDASSLPAALSVNGANVHATTSTFPSETTTTLTGVLAGGGAGATITGDVTVSFKRSNAMAPSTGTGPIVLSVAPR